MICEVGLKQNVGHLGTEIVFGWCHVNNRTAKEEWAQVLAELWDKLCLWIRLFSIKFLSGDFNMSLTQVVQQLRSRGIPIDCVAWYPWLKSTVAPAQVSQLGTDSCGIFCIGGDASVQLTWGPRDIDELVSAVAADSRLDVFEGSSLPGQHWKCYIPKSQTPREKLEQLVGAAVSHKGRVATFHFQNQ